MINGYAKMRLLDALIGRILDIHQTHWTQTHQTHFRTARHHGPDNCATAPRHSTVKDATSPLKRQLFIIVRIIHHYYVAVSPHLTYKNPYQ